MYTHAKVFPLAARSRNLARTTLAGTFSRNSASRFQARVLAKRTERGGGQISRLFLAATEKLLRNSSSGTDASSCQR